MTTATFEALHVSISDDPYFYDEIYYSVGETTGDLFDTNGDAFELSYTYLDSSSTSVRLDGDIVWQEAFRELGRSDDAPTASIYNISWNGNDTQVLSLVQYVSGFDYFTVSYYDFIDQILITLGGTALPEFDDYDAYRTFLEDTAVISRIPSGSDFGPDSVTEFDDLPGVTVTEDDIVRGTDRSDTIMTGIGNDMIFGSARADHIDGGAGRDTIDYGGSFVRVDLIYGDNNAGLAQGDVLVNIENVYGTDGTDRLLGSHVNNLLVGEGGNDWLAGRQGDDALRGGAGRDTLTGGAGADLLVGGEGGADRASYHLSSQGLTVDLLHAANNTGEAAGDRFVGIEGLIGSQHGDILRGDAGNNRLIALAGDDVMQGRDGDDLLFGGAGNDIMNGGSGDDRLSGGAGRDTFRFDGGMDVVVDLRDDVDRLQISNAFASGSELTNADLEAAATLVDGVLVLDFGGGNSITLLGHSSLAPLLDDISGF